MNIVNNNLLRTLILVIFSLVFVGINHIVSQTSVSARVKSDTLIKVNANTDKGFNYPYFLFIPKDVEVENKVNLLVQTNNTGFPNDTLSVHENDAGNVAGNRFYMGNYVSCRLSIPLLVPVFPRPESNWRIYTHALDRDAVMAKGDMKRLDLQLIKMINDAKQRLRYLGINTDEKILITGFSASGTFANRFTTIHPEIVAACACGGINAMPLLPVSDHKDHELIYPVGIYDFHDLFGKQFNRESYSEVPQYLFMGEKDNNDAVQFNDGYSDLDREIIPAVLGNSMMPDRWNSCEKIFNDENINAVFMTYKNQGHRVDTTIKNDVVKFFKEKINSNNN